LSYMRKKWKERKEISKGTLSFNEIIGLGVSFVALMGYALAFCPHASYPHALEWAGVIWMWLFCFYLCWRMRREGRRVEEPLLLIPLAGFILLGIYHLLTSYKIISYPELTSKWPVTIVWFIYCMIPAVRAYLSKRSSAP
jgi:hypothetical protein